MQLKNLTMFLWPYLTFFLLLLKIADPTPLLPAFMKFLHSIAACPTYKCDKAVE